MPSFTFLLLFLNASIASSESYDLSIICNSSSELFKLLFFPFFGTVVEMILFSLSFIAFTSSNLSSISSSESFLKFLPLNLSCNSIDIGLVLFFFVFFISSLLCALNEVPTLTNPLFLLSNLASFHLSIKCLAISLTTGPITIV